MVERRESKNTAPSPGNHGPLTRKVLDYEGLMRRLLPTVKEAKDWSPLAEFVAIEDFQRVGCFLEVQNWTEYAQMLTQWATSTAKFETTLRRVSELPRRVYFEVEERHFRGESVEVVNSMSVFEFDEAAKIRRLAVYLQRR